jgi:hypothetical protein
LGRNAGAASLCLFSISSWWILSSFPGLLPPESFDHPLALGFLADCHHPSILLVGASSGFSPKSSLSRPAVFSANSGSSSGGLPRITTTVL